MSKFVKVLEASFPTQKTASKCVITAVDQSALERRRRRREKLQHSLANWLSLRKPVKIQWKLKFESSKSIFFEDNFLYVVRGKEIHGNHHLPSLLVGRVRGSLAPFSKKKEKIQLQFEFSRSRYLQPPLKTRIHKWSC